ncbi:MAG: hypothetical protein MJ211_05355 [Bacteroidales bacterium]|nr:hypothetical protein [Bacteroidales bacterium]
MTEDVKEKLWIQDRINYNQHWHENNVWKSQLQKDLDTYLAKHNLKQILNPCLVLPNTYQVLSNPQNADIDKIFSIILDIYEELPYRPDMAFDLCWRPFEILIGKYLKSIKSDNKSTNKNILTISEKVFIPLYNNNKQIKNLINRIIDEMPISAINFCLNKIANNPNITRNATPEELSSDYSLNEDNSQVYFIKERIKIALGDTLYNTIVNKYFNEEFQRNLNNGNDCLIAPTMHNAVLAFKNYILKVGKQFDGIEIPIERKLALVIGILYTSRNNRFHGDNFSHFKSNRSKLKNYKEFYYFLTTNFFLLWTLLYKYLEKNKIEQFIDINEIVNSINISFDNMKDLEKT